MEKELLELVARLPELKEVGQAYITYKYVELFVVPIAVVFIIGSLIVISFWALTHYGDRP